VALAFGRNRARGHRGEKLVSDLFKRTKALLGRGEPEAKPASVKKPANPWHAISIVPGPDACADARELLGKRFLSREAPSLPLRKCDNPKCTCRYEHHENRRKGPRRFRELGVSIDGYQDEDRRDETKRGRRKTDL
jgi:hypothetical protein